MYPNAPLEERVLVLAPDESDAKLISAAAARGGFTAEITADMAHLCAAIGEGAGTVVLVEAAFSTVSMRRGEAHE